MFFECLIGVLVNAHKSKKLTCYCLLCTFWSRYLNIFKWKVKYEKMLNCIFVCRALWALRLLDAHLRLLMVYIHDGKYSSQNNSNWSICLGSLPHYHIWTCTFLKKWYICNLLHLVSVKAMQVQVCRSSVSNHHLFVLKMALQLSFHFMPFPSLIFYMFL